MAFSIALSGKGGTGKTTLASLIVRWLIENRKKAVFAVDADPNYTLASALGVKVEWVTLQYIDYNSSDGTPEEPADDTTKKWWDENVNDSTVWRLPRAILIELRLADGKGVISMVLSSGAHLGGSGI